MAFRYEMESRPGDWAPTRQRLNDLVNEHLADSFLDQDLFNHPYRFPLNGSIRGNQPSFAKMPIVTRVTRAGGSAAWKDTRRTWDSPWVKY